MILFLVWRENFNLKVREVRALSEDLGQDDE